MGYVFSEEKRLSLLSTLSAKGGNTDKKRVEKLTIIKNTKAKTWSQVEVHTGLEGLISFLNSGIPSIEYEIARADLQFFTKYGIRTHRESLKIVEAGQIIPPNSELSLYEELKERYGTCFPVGESDLVSGGTHLHLHFPEEDDIKNQIKTKNKYIYGGITAYPFYSKIHLLEDKAKFVARCGKMGMELASLNNNIYLGRNVGISIRMSGIGYRGGRTTQSGKLHSLEYRLNNVVNADIVGFYKVLTLAVVCASTGKTTGNQTMDKIIKKVKKETRRYIKYKTYDTQDKLCEYIERGEKGNKYNTSRGFPTTEMESYRTSQEGIIPINVCEGYVVSKKEYQEMVSDISTAEEEIFGTTYFAQYIKWVEKANKKIVVRQTQAVEQEAMVEQEVAVDMPF